MLSGLGAAFAERYEIHKFLSVLRFSEIDAGERAGVGGVFILIEPVARPLADAGLANLAWNVR